MQMKLVFQLFWKEIRKPFADSGNRLRRTTRTVGDANVNVKTIIPQWFSTIPQEDPQDLPVVHTMVSQVIVTACDPEMQMGLVFPLFWKEIRGARFLLDIRINST